LFSESQKVHKDVGIFGSIARDSSMWSAAKSDGAAKLMQHFELALK
jgi:predicted nucleotidyltransferase